MVSGGELGFSHQLADDPMDPAKINQLFDHAAWTGAMPPEPDDAAARAQLEVQQAKEKMLMEFDLGPARPKRVTIEVLQQMIRSQPDRMSLTLRNWLRRRT